MFFPLSRVSVMALHHGFDFVRCVLAYRLVQNGSELFS